MVVYVVYKLNINKQPEIGPCLQHHSSCLWICYACLHVSVWLCFMVLKSEKYGQLNYCELQTGKMKGRPCSLSADGGHEPGSS